MCRGESEQAMSVTKADEDTIKRAKSDWEEVCKMPGGLCNHGSAAFKLTKYVPRLLKIIDQQAAEIAEKDAELERLRMEDAATKFLTENDEKDRRIEEAERLLCAKVTENTMDGAVRLIEEIEDFLGYQIPRERRGA